MNIPNEALNLLAKVIKQSENHVLNVANYVNYLQQANPNPNGALKLKLEIEEQRLESWIIEHEQLQTMFTELCDYLEKNELEKKESNRVAYTAIEKVKSISLINKDAIYWREKATFYNATRKILFDELQKVKAENQQLKHGKTIQPG